MSSHVSDLGTVSFVIIATRFTSENLGFYRRLTRMKRQFALFQLRSSRCYFDFLH